MKYIPILILIFFSCFCNAQDTLKYAANRMNPDLQIMEIGKKNNGKYNGIVSTYHLWKNDKNYVLYSKEYYKEGFKIGPDSIFNNKGQIILVEVYVDSLHNYTEFYPNGNIKSKSYYKHGKRTDLWTEFYESGNIKEIYFYENDIMQGNSISYFENGKLFEMGYYVNGFKSGQWIEGDSSGLKIMKGNYLPISINKRELVKIPIVPDDPTIFTVDTVEWTCYGIKNGIWTIYDIKKNEIRKVKFVKGELKN